MKTLHMSLPLRRVKPEGKSQRSDSAGSDVLSRSESFRGLDRETSSLEAKLSTPNQRG